MRVWDKSKPPRGPFVLNKDAPQAQGLISWYPMGGASKLWVPDYIGPNHLTMGTDPGFTVGQAGSTVITPVAASSMYLEGVMAGASALPLTIACWANDSSGGTARALICVGTNGANGRIQLQVDTGRHMLAGTSNAAGAGVTTPTTNTYTDNIDFHAAGVFTSTTSRTPYLNGAAGTTETTSIDPSGMDRMILGARRNSTGVAAFWLGQIGESGVWNIALDNPTIIRLADPGKRFELWYPLRSPKWISIAAAPGSIIGPLIGGRHLLNNGPLVGGRLV